MNIDNQDVHLRDYWKIISKHRNTVLTFFSIVVSMVMIFSYTTAPVYEGTTRFLIEIADNPTMTFIDNNGFSRNKIKKEIFFTHKGIMESRIFADKVVRKLQLDTNPYFINNIEKAKISPVTKLKKLLKEKIKDIFPTSESSRDISIKLSSPEELDSNLTDIVLEGMKIEVGRDNNIFKIYFNSANPGIAAYMANGIARTYIEYNMEIKVRPFKDAVEWLSSRLVELRTTVEKSERGLQHYKEEKGIVSFEGNKNIITQKLQELISQMIHTSGKRQEAEAKYYQIKSVINDLDRLEAVPEIMNNQVIQSLRTDELRLQREISALSGKYGPKHPNMIKTVSKLQEVRKNLSLETRKMLNAAKTNYEIAKSREASLNKAIEAQKLNVLELSKKSIEFNVVAREAKTNKRFYDLLLNKMQEASLSSGINISNIQIIDYAIIPKSPIKPKRVLNLLLSVIVGLLGGVGMVFFVEYMDDTINTPEELETIFSLPFLGLVLLAGKDEKICFPERKSHLAEAYTAIRTSLMLSCVEKSPKVILITSAIPNEGKTSTAANLAVLMADMGEKVIIVDGDMRRHNIHKVFSVNNTKGLSNLIVDPGKLAEVVKQNPQFPNLSIITGGTVPPNPPELLGSNKFKDLLEDLRGEYDRIIIDSPPVMAISDTLLLSNLADGVIIVVCGGSTSRDMIKKTYSSLVKVNAKILGAILNKVVIRKGGYNDHYYPYYNYYTDEKSK